MFSYDVQKGDGTVTQVLTDRNKLIKVNKLKIFLHGKYVRSKIDIYKRYMLTFGILFHQESTIELSISI